MMSMQAPLATAVRRAVPVDLVPPVLAPWKAFWEAQLFEVMMTLLTRSLAERAIPYRLAVVLLAAAWVAAVPSLVGGMSSAGGSRKRLWCRFLITMELVLSQSDCSGSLVAGFSNGAPGPGSIGSSLASNNFGLNHNAGTPGLGSNPPDCLVAGQQDPWARVFDRLGSSTLRIRDAWQQTVLVVVDPMEEAPLVLEALEARCMAHLSRTTDTHSELDTLVSFTIKWA